MGWGSKPPLPGTGGAFAFNVSEGDTAFGHVVGGEFKCDLVASQDADVVHAHLACGLGHEFVAVVQSDTVARVGKHLAHQAGHFQHFFFGHLNV